MLLFMSNRRAEDWRELESMEDAARRLLQELDERVRRRAAERLEASAKIQDQQPQLSPGRAEHADGASDGVSGSLKRRPQQFTNREAAGDPVAGEGGSGNGLEFDGRADLSTLDFVHVNPEGTARPSLDEPPVKDRAVTRSRDF